MAKFAVLNHNSDFRALYYRGKSQAHAVLITYALRQTARRHPRRGPGMTQKPAPLLPGPTRVGITTGKKVGNAVQRSRSRRVIREAWRALLPAAQSGWDIVFVARARTVSAKSGDLRRVMERQLTALGVLARPSGQGNARPSGT